ncbi:hypothetical protein ACHMW6_06720 [Pseudoduganella sp. UC29_106]|uniref:hypothetical protein n=1 Tax=Pseudoduganella sp. UC29_106 TaxID=3374553 RepID=UPI003756D500
MLRDQTVEIRLSANEAALLGKGKRIYISKCWHDGVEGQFVRNVHGGYGGGYQADGLYFGSASIAVMGAELDIFIGGLFSTAAPLVQGATSAPGAEPAPPQTWQDAVRIIADELDAIDNQAGAWSSKADMSRRVAEIADKRGIKGAGSKKLTDGNILREALSGGAWRRKVIKKPKNGNSGESGEAREE